MRRLRFDENRFVLRDIVASDLEARALMFVECFSHAWRIEHQLSGKCRVSQNSFESTQLLVLATEMVGIGTVPTLGGAHELFIFT